MCTINDSRVFKSATPVNHDAPVQVQEAQLLPSNTTAGYRRTEVCLTFQLDTNMTPENL